MRIFLSFNSKDTSSAEAIRAGLLKLEPKAEIFFSPVSVSQGFWLPKLAAGIGAADAFLLVLGPKGIGPWQELEYHEAFDRHVHDPSFALVPVIASGGSAPGLPFLRRLNWIEVSEVTDDKAMHRVLGALKGEAGATPSPLWRLVHPYRALEAMTEANADYFYGRATETESVLEALGGKPGRLSILIGASGVGKSSVAQAGVLSALKAMKWPGKTDGPSLTRPWPDAFRNSRAGWAWLIVRPGEEPLQALASAFTRLWLTDATDPERGPLARKWADGLRGSNTLADLIDATQEQLETRQGAKPDRILIYLDQAEELYTRALRTAPKDARRFSEVLAQALVDPRLLAFASLRADYFDRLQADEALYSVFEHVNVPPLTRGQLSEVVTGAAKALGVSFEDERLPNRIIDAAASEPGALPLLSYLLTDMWSGMVKRGEAVLRLPSEAIDVGGVLAARAEEFLAISPVEEPALKRLLTLKLALVPADGEPMRRPARRMECTAEEWALAERLADHPWRLIVTGERDRDGEVVAEVAHEALLRAWPRLSGWLKEERDFLVFKGEAERAERRWRGMGFADQALLTGIDLARAEEWLPTRAEDLTAEVRAFLQRSIAADRAARNRRLRFQRRVSAGAVAAALLMAGFGAFAWHQWREAVAAKQHAENTLAAATRTANALVFDLGRKFKNTVGIPLTLIRDILDRAQGLLEDLSKGDVASPEMLRTKAVALVEVAESLEKAGDTKNAREVAAASLAIIEKLAGSYPARADLQRDLSVGLEKIADIAWDVGDRLGALANYERSLAIREKLVAADPIRADWQNGVAVGLEKIAEVLLAGGDRAGALAKQQRSLAIREKLIADDPTRADWQSGMSANLQKIAEVLLAGGDRAKALANHQDALAIRQKLAAADPLHAQWQQNLAISLERIADLLGTGGDRAGALANYQKSLAIAEKLAAADPARTDWRRNLSWSFEKIADMLWLGGDQTGALGNFEKSLAIREKLIVADPARTDWQRDLTFSLEKIANTLALATSDHARVLANYQRSLAIRERLVDTDPAHAQWQSDVADSLDGIGQVLLARGDRMGALANYQRSFAIREKLAAADPLHAQWQLNLSNGLEKFGHALLTAGDRAGALGNFQRSLDMRERLATADPSHTVWRWSVSLGLDNIAYVLMVGGNRTGALENYRRSLAIRESLAAADPANSMWQFSLSTSLNAIAYMLEDGGDGEGGLANRRRALSIMEKLAAADPGHVGWQSSLATALSGARLETADERMGALKRSLTILEKLTATDPGRVDWQWQLALNLHSIGLLAERAADRAGAIANYQRSLAIMEKIAAGDPGRADWRTSLALNLDGIARLLTAAGDRTEALVNYQKSLAIREALVAVDPTQTEWQFGLESNLSNIAQLLVDAGDRAGALANYQRSITILDQLISTDPARTDWQLFLALRLDAIARLLVDTGDRAGALTNYQRSLTILEKLTAADLPGDLPDPQSFAAMSAESIGRLLVDAGDRAGALTNYQRSVAIREKLAAANPADNEEQVSLALTYSIVGGVAWESHDKLAARDNLGKALAILKQLDREGRLAPHEKSYISSIEAAQAEDERTTAAELLEAGDRTSALAHYQKSLAIVEKLAATDPARVDWQREIAKNLDKIADVLWADGDPTGAHAARTGSLTIREKLVVMIEEEETRSTGKPGSGTANALINAAWQALFTGDFAKALAASERAIALMPDDLSPETNRAHALLFLGRGDEAKALYLAYKGKTTSDNQAWEQIIAFDFAEFRKAGRTHPMMAEIEAVLGIAPALR
jgi:tetratricopeptide (TPR) repeat protein